MGARLWFPVVKETPQDYRGVSFLAFLSRIRRMLTKRFTRNREDFICAYCTSTVQGNGYTNHCPRCLWSKHVDIFPGDRRQMCGGLMEPYAMEGSTRTWRIRYRCLSCGHEGRNKCAVNDNKDALLTLAEQQGEAF
jgi:hypothetical protein